MARFLALGWVCSLFLSATGAASIPESELGPGSMDAASPFSPSRHSVHTAMEGDNVGQHPEFIDTREPITRGSPSQPSPPLTPARPTSSQQPLTDNVPVNSWTSSSPAASTANDHTDVKHRPKRSSQSGGIVNDSEKEDWVRAEVAPWPVLTTSLVQIYTTEDEPQYVAAGYDVRWDGEGRQGPSFTCDSIPSEEHRLFLARNFEENGTVHSFQNGSVKLRSSGRYHKYFKDSRGEVTFHFQPVEGDDGDLYRIFYSRNGVPDGPPARCNDNENTLFHVRVVAYPTSVSRMRVVESFPTKVYNTTFQYATTSCNYSCVYDYTSSYGDTDFVEMLGGAPNVTLKAPVPGIEGNLTVTEGTFSRTVRSEISVPVTITVGQATLVAVTWEEERSSKVWHGVMSYGRFNAMRRVAGRSNTTRKRRLISVKTYPGHSFFPGNCVPINTVLSGSGMTADGERVVWFDNQVDYRWVPRLQWMPGKHGRVNISYIPS